MEFYYHDADSDVLVIKADGGLNGHNAGDFVDRIRQLVDAGLRKLIVDCEHLDYISSVGLAVLLRLHKKIAEHEGNLKLAHVKGMVPQVLQVTGLSRIFHLYPDIEQARLSFKEPQT